MAERTIYSLLDEAVEKWGNAQALHQPVGGQKYQSYTWVEYREIVREIAAGLRSVGVHKGDIVGLGSETRAEFYFADLGTMTSGAAAAALYVNSPAAEQVALLRKCGAKLIFIEDPKMLSNLLEAGADQLGAQWVLMTGATDGVMTLADLREKGRNALVADAGFFSAIRAQVTPADDAILYLTSGATGDPKMVYTTHGALVANVDMGPFCLLDGGPKDCALAFLPSAHIAQRVGIELLPLRLGIPVYFSESLARMPHEFKFVRPTMFLAPPRVWERIYASVRTEIRKRGAVSRQIFYASLGIGSQVSRYKQQGKPVPLWLEKSWNIADKLVFQKIRDRFGGRMRYAISGAAPLSRDLGEFYEAIGMPLMEGYGLTEGGVLSLNPETGPRLGTIGKPLRGVECKLGEDGELLINSPSLARAYFKDDVATAEVFRNGWLHTGDLATISEDGYVAITGRKKEMIVSSNGKKVYPSKLEALFKTEPLVSQIILIGDKQPFVTALFTINPGAAEVIKGMEDLQGKPIAELAAAAPVQAEIKRAVQRANKQLAQYEQIRKFRVLDREFTIDDGELTPTMKVRRMNVIENFKTLIAGMYVGGGPADN